MGTEIDGYMIEDDSLTGDDVKEETLVLSKIHFSYPSFSSTNAHDAIVEAKTATGHFSYNIINFNGIIDFGQQMFVFQDLKVLNTGSLTISGECVICH